MQEKKIPLAEVWRIQAAVAGLDIAAF